MSIIQRYYDFVSHEGWVAAIYSFGPNGRSPYMDGQLSQTIHATHRVITREITDDGNGLGHTFKEFYTGSDDPEFLEMYGDSHLLSDCWLKPVEG